MEAIRARRSCARALGPLLKSRKVTRAEVVDEAEEEGMTPDELNASNDG